MKYLKLLVLFLFICGTEQSVAQLNLNLLGTLSYPGLTCAGVWHYVDSTGNEYALVGVSDRLSIVDVTNPATPTEVFSVPALPNQSSLWREVKTYGSYAYAVSEGGGGVICINLSYLPDSIQYNHWYGNNDILGQLTSAHTVAATDGYLYVFGATLSNGGALIADLVDPMNPNYLGAYSTEYIHDGYIRNDTLWAGEIYEGQFSVIDVSDKTNPILMATMPTPGLFCHNTWLSDDGTFLYTTDERPNVPLGSFNVHDINNIELVDVYFTDSMPTAEVHNVRVLDDYLINPSYGSQLTICDATYPNNIIEVANYPTGTYLCWDASPYLPSGNIIATDMNNGMLYVFDPTYVRACYLEGHVKDSLTGNPIPQALIRILGSSASANSALDGNYNSGILAPGNYDIEVSKGGYLTQVFTNVPLNTGVVTFVNAAMLPFSMSASVTDASTSNAIAGADLVLTNSSHSFQLTSNASGQFNTSGFVSGTFHASVTKWGYETYCDSVIIDGVTPLTFQLEPGYYDDFITDEGWTITSTASSGLWERAIPVGTTYLGAQANPGVDLANDCGELAFVTGNGGGTATTDDVDNGSTTLLSPVMDLSGYANPSIEYHTWLYLPNNISVSSYDTMFISLNNGITTVVIDTITATLPMSTWNVRSRRVLDYMQPTANMQLEVFIEDKLTGTNILEGGFDQFRVIDITQGVAELSNSEFSVFPNPFSNELRIRIPGQKNFADFTAEICDVTGRNIATEKINSQDHSLLAATKLPAGIYLLNIYNGSKFKGALRIVRAK